MRQCAVWKGARAAEVVIIEEAWWSGFWMEGVCCGRGIINTKQMIPVSQTANRVRKMRISNNGLLVLREAIASSASIAIITTEECPNCQRCLYSQWCTCSHFLWLSGPHSESAPFLINQDVYPLMHRDEQSAWQAGSYSFLTPAHTAWCNGTAAPSLFLLFLLPSLQACSLYSFSHSLPISLPSLLIFAHCLSSLFPFLSLTPPPPNCNSLASSLSPSQSLFFPEAHVSLLALHTITSIHQLSAYSSLATPLPFLYSMTTPTTLITRVSLQPPSLTRHPLAKSTSLRSPPPSLSAPFLFSPCNRCPLKFGWGCACGGEGRNKRMGWWWW